MKREEFLADLPIETRCDRCGRPHKDLDWATGSFGAHEWIGICVVRCDKCSRVMVAAAGTTYEAHHRAQMMRLELIVSMERNSKNGINGINDINRYGRKGPE